MQIYEAFGIFFYDLLYNAEHRIIIYKRLRYYSTYGQMLLEWLLRQPYLFCLL